METFLRRLEILNFLKSNSHQALGTDEIIQHLIEAGYVDEYANKRKSVFRLIQRDLNFLLGEEFDEGEFENDFGLTMERGQRKSLLWKLDPFQSLNYSFEKIPDYMALALSISQKHLKQVLPANTQEALRAIFERANIKLSQQEKALSPKHYQTLTNAVEFFQRGQQLKPPEFDESVLTQIYSAILNRKRLLISYQSSGKNKDYELHPFGVAIMLPKLYLVAKKEGDLDKGDEAFRSFLIHKITSIEVSPQNNHVPEDFLLKTYLDAGNMDVMLDYKDLSHYGLILEIETHAQSNLLLDLKDSPIALDQTLTELETGKWQLTAKVRRTVQLRNWLLALGSQAKVIEPKIIRQDLVNYLNELLDNYQDA